MPAHTGHFGALLRLSPESLGTAPVPYPFCVATEKISGCGPLLPLLRSRGGLSSAVRNAQLSQVPSILQYQQGVVALRSLLIGTGTHGGEFLAATVMFSGRKHTHTQTFSSSQNTC